MGVGKAGSEGARTHDRSSCCIENVTEELFKVSIWIDVDASEIDEAASGGVLGGVKVDGSKLAIVEICCGVVGC